MNTVDTTGARKSTKLTMKRILKETAAVIWDVRPVAIAVEYIPRGSGWIAKVRYATRELESYGATMEVAQHRLAQRLYRKIEWRLARQLRVMMAHQGKPLPHRYRNLPNVTPLPDPNYQRAVKSIEKRRQRLRADQKNSHGSVAA